CLEYLRPHRATPFPYTTLFRSSRCQRVCFGLGVETLLWGQLVATAAQAREQPHHEVARAHGVGEAGVLCTREHQGRQPELLHTRSEEHTSELQSRENLVCRLLL